MVELKESLIELQTRLAFLDDTVTALNDAVAGHEQKIERLERALLAVQEQLRTMDATGNADEQAPPHY